MSRLTTDYTGRQIDLMSMRVDLERAGIQRAPLGFYYPPKFITGVQQAVQAYVSLLLTRKGTAAPSNRGTDFLLYMTTRNPRTEAQIRNYFMLSSADAMKQVNEEAISEDERIASVTLLAAVLTSGSVSLRLRLVTEAGESSLVHLPLEGI